MKITRIRMHIKQLSSQPKFLEETSGGGGGGFSQDGDTLTELRGRMFCLLPPPLLWALPTEAGYSNARNCFKACH